MTWEFTIEDGSKFLVETKVEERKKAEAEYEDAVAAGKTAVFGSYIKTNNDIVKIRTGLFPAMSRAKLKVYYYQQLEYEDMSYCLRIPQAYIPKYIFNMFTAV